MHLIVNASIVRAWMKWVAHALDRDLHHDSGMDQGWRMHLIVNVIIARAWMQWAADALVREGCHFQAWMQWVDSRNTIPAT